MDWREFSAKTVDEALTNAMLEMSTTIDNLEYEVIEKETSGFLGMFSKPARIKVRLKMSLENIARDFLEKIFNVMNMEAEIDIAYNEENEMLEVNVKGEDMGILIGKRGQTLDSLQYLVSLVINKSSDNYIKVKLDTENYRARRKETLENLAKNIAYKVKRTRKPVTLEPMNPYERRIIHSALQNDKFVETYSEGDEPFRKVVISTKRNTGRDAKPYKNNREYNKEYNKNYSRDYKKDYKEYKESKAKKNSAENA